MNKKGFTLLEVLSVIVIISVLDLLFVSNFMGNKSYSLINEDVNKTIKLASEAYIYANKEEKTKLYEEPYYLDITIGQLIDEGYLKEKFSDSEGNPISNSQVIRATINQITGEINYSYIEE